MYYATPQKMEWNQWRYNKLLNKLKSYVYSSQLIYLETKFHTGLHLQFTQATFSEYYFCRNVFKLKQQKERERGERERERGIISINTPIKNFARSDSLIMTLTNSHSLINKIRLALAFNNSGSLSLALAFAPKSNVYEMK